jgi:hypothetical protein
MDTAGAGRPSLQTSGARHFSASACQIAVLVLIFRGHVALAGVAVFRIWVGKLLYPLAILLDLLVGELV